jgi:hypothetical protein
VPAVLYGREIWPLTLREKHRQKVFENSVLRRIFRLKRDGLTGKAKSYVGVVISPWLFLFEAQPKEFFLGGLKKLEQRSHKCVELRGEYVE